MNLQDMLVLSAKVSCLLSSAEHQNSKYSCTLAGRIHEKYWRDTLAESFSLALVEVLKKERDRLALMRQAAETGGGHPFAAKLLVQQARVEEALGDLEDPD